MVHVHYHHHQRRLGSGSIFLFDASLDMHTARIVALRLAGILTGVSGGGGMNSKQNVIF